MRVGQRGHDSGSEIVLQREDVLRLEGAIVGLGPQMGGGVRVDQLGRHTERGARLTEGSFDHVAGAEPGTDGADVSCLAGEWQRGARER